MLSKTINFLSFASSHVRKALKVNAYIILSNFSIAKYVLGKLLELS